MDTQSIVGTAPVKLLLLGEHTVLYGLPALSMPLPLLTRVSLVPTNKNTTITSNYPFSQEDEDHLLTQFRLIARELSLHHFPPLQITIELPVPPGSGFGISASVAMASIRALAQFFQKNISAEQEEKIATLCEEKNHGQASGIDHLTIIRNEPLRFQKQNDILQITPFPELSNNAIFDHLHCIHTGMPMETTREMVEHVRNFAEQEPQKMPAILEGMQESIQAGIAALEQGVLSQFLPTVNRCGELLEQLGVVSDPVRTFSKRIRERGGSAKISGAGGRQQGSGLLLVWHEDQDFISQLCSEYGFREMMIRPQ